MSMELSKKDKRTAREIIARGIELDLEKALNDASAILEEWKSKQLNNRDAYKKLYQYLEAYDDELERQYQDRNSTLLFSLAYQLVEGFITESDLEPLSDEVKGTLRRWMAAREEDN